jgi:uncharacterized protein YjeT (DUF2065 family)
MAYLITAIGILFVVVGVIYTVKPSIIRAFIDFAKVGKRIYFLAPIRLVLGAALLVAAPKAVNVWIPGIIGAILVISGISIYFLGLARIGAIMDWWKALPDNKLRIVTILAAVLGVLLIYSA